MAGRAGCRVGRDVGGRREGLGRRREEERLRLRGAAPVGTLEQAGGAALRLGDARVVVRRRDVEKRDEGPEDERGAARGPQPARDAPEEGGPGHAGEG